MTSVSRGAMQTPDEVLAALRARGAQISTPPSVKAAGSEGAARSTEEIALFMRLGGAVCSIVRFDDDLSDEEPPYVDGVIAVLAGGSFIAAFGPEALDPAEPRGVRPVVMSVVASSHSLGGRGVIYTDPEGVDPSIFDVEVLSLRASVEPFVREALRAHAEGLTSARESGREGRLDPALARVVLTAGEDSAGLPNQELEAGEAIRSAMAASQRVVVLGDFGSGRSTELARRAAVMAATYLESRDELPCPVLLPLRGMRPDLGAILREHVPGLSPDAFRLAAELGMIVSFFDGFDELDLRPGKAELALALKAITSFAHGGKARLVISLSRSSALALPLHELLADEPDAPFSVVTLRGFGREGALRLPREPRASKDETPTTRRAPDAPEDGGSRAAALTVEAMDRAKTFAIAMRDWIRSELSFRPDSPPQGASDELVERSLAATRRAAKVLFTRDIEEAPLEVIAPSGDGAGSTQPTRAGAAEGRALVELILGAALFRVKAPPAGSNEAPRVGFAHRSFLEALVAQDIAIRLDEGSGGLDALDLPPLSPTIIGFLAGIDGWDRRKKRLREALAQPYRARVSENALLAIYGAARARLRGEALGKRLSDDLPPKVKLAGAKLAGAHLAWASLPEADLTGADLSLADLSLADLRGARLDEARADHAVFDGADLEWATCVKADLFGASFVSANVAGMKRSDANTEGAIWIAARGDEGGFIKRGIDAPPDQPIGWFIESAPHMGQALALSPDGRWVAVGRGFTVAILDAKTGHVRLILPGSTGCALAVVFSPDGRLLVSAAKDGSIRVWDARRGALLRAVETEPSWAIALAFSPDSSMLLSASDGGSVRLWDMPRCELIRVVGGPISWFYSVAFSPTGGLFAAALADGSLRVWDAQKGSLLRTIHAPLGPYPCVSFSADGALIFAPCGDGSVRAWDARSGDPRLVLSVTPDGASRTPNAPPTEQDPPSDKRALSMAITCSPDGAWIAAASSSGVTLWDARRPQRAAALVEGSRDACSIAFTPDGDDILFTLSDGSIHAAETRSGRLLRTLRKHARTVDSAVFSPSGDTIASASSGGSIRVWDARRGDLLHTLEGPAAMGTSIVFSHSGDTLAVVMADGSVRMWDARRGDLVHTLRAPDHDVVALAFSPDGDALASGALDGSIALWDTSGRGVVRHLLGGSGRVTSLAFSPSGDRLAAADVDGSIRLWDPRAGVPLGVLSGHEDAVHSIAFLPDGDKLASASADGSIRLWDARALATTHVVLSRGGPVHSVTFSPEGDKLASAYADGTVRLWDAAQGELIEVLEGHTASVSSAAFSLDGEVLVTASADGTVRLWRVADGRCLCMMLAVDAGWITLAGDAPFFIGGGDVSALLRFTAGSSSMPASLWAPVFRRPDLVAKTLWGESPSSASLGLSRIDACEAALVDARARLSIGQSRRQGLTGVIAVAQHITGRPGPRTDDGPRTPSGPRPPMKRALTWLHLADLHFEASLRREPHRFSQGAVVEAIRRDVAQGNIKDPDFIFVTGDVAWSGQAAEYNHAEQWLRAVAEAAGAPFDRVRLVPGNHDVDRARTNNKAVARAHSKLRAAPEELDNDLADEARRATLADKLSDYAAFVRGALPSHPAAGPSGIDWSERLSAVAGRRGRTRVAGLSTVWVSDASDGRLHKGQALPFVRNMIVGQRQIEQALAGLEEDELVILLTHHPVDWLHRDSADELANVLAKRPFIHLHSHIHDAGGAVDPKRFGAVGPKIRYAAGSAHGDPAESKRHGYGWGAVRWNGDARIWQAGWAPRVYDDSRGQMRPDVSRGALDPDGFLWETLRAPWRSPLAVEVQG